MTATSALKILHGTCWLQSGGLLLILWMETDVKRKKANPRLYPYCEKSLAVKKFIDNTLINSGRHADITSVIAHIPTTGNFPLVSNELSGLVEIDSSPEPGTIQMQEWTIDAVSLNPAYAFEFLIGIADHVDKNGVVIGSDLKFWISAANLAKHLIGAGKILPAVVEEGESIRSRWMLLLETRDEQNLVYELSRKMPESCLMLNYGYTDPESLTRAFLSSVVDSTCRNYAAGIKPPMSENNVGDIYRWALSLATDNSLVSYGKSVAIRRIMEWSRRIHQRLDSPLRMGFRLTAPDNEQGQWKLEFLIQSKADPTLVVPLSDVWNRNNPALSFIRKITEFPEEFILQSLGVAQSIYPEISRGLQYAKPWGIDLSTEQVYEFLKKYATVLNGSDFGLVLPDWWHAKKRIASRIRASPANSSGTARLGASSLINYELEIMVDGEPISEKELRRLASLKVPLVRIGERWVEIEKGQIESALKMIEKGKYGVQISTLLSMDAEPDTLPIMEISGKGWVSDLLNGKSRETGVEAPARFAGKLRKYQEEGLSWISFLSDLGFGSCLADDMGLGKTIQIIAYLLHRKEINGGGVTLIVCPTSVVTNWLHELGRFAPTLNVLVHHGIDRRKEDAFISDLVGYDVVLTSYSLVQRDFQTISKVKWDGIVADEAQYIKNQGTKQSKAIKALQGNFRIALTGTPVENRLSELWSIFEFINPGYLGTPKRFRDLFAVPVEKEGDERAGSVLSRLISPFVLRRLKSDKKIAPDLPEKNEAKMYVPVTQEQATLYSATVEGMLESLADKEGIERKGLVLATITKLKRLLDHPSLVSGDTDRRGERSQKLKRLLEMLEETVSEGHKALVFTQYVDAGKIIKEETQRLLGQEVLLLSGEVPRPIRDQMVQRFQDSSGPKIFVISVRAGGFGLNLTAATTVFHFDRWWNPAVEDQATDRAYRIGQTKNVQVYKFVSTGTIEEKIDSLIESKGRITEKIVKASGESWITELSNGALKDIMSLRTDALSLSGGN
jgi:SNF2 family DNA or RNA helicase